MTEIEAPVSMPEADALTPAQDELKEVEARLRRLEDAVAALQGTKRFESAPPENDSRERKTARRGRKTEIITDASRQLLPMAIGLLAGTTPTADPPAAIPVAMPVSISANHAWVFLEVVNEMRSIIRMVRDRRYRLSWFALIVPVGAIFLVVLSWLTLGNIPFVGWMLDRTVDLLLALVVYKVLLREAKRYQEIMTYPPPIATIH